jgi:hypothetical protein
MTTKALTKINELVDRPLPRKLDQSKLEILGD